MMDRYSKLAEVTNEIKEDTKKYKKYSELIINYQSRV